MEIGLRWENYRKTLSEASRDDSADVSLIDSPCKAYKLDDYSVKVCRKLRGGVTLAGCDAFCESGGTFWFIEFKNQDAKDIDAEEIRKKAYDSISTVRMAVDQEITLDELCGRAVFLVVYRDEDPSAEDAIERAVAGLAGMYPIRWGLRKILGKLYREIHTIPAAAFCEKWIPVIWGEEIQQL
ncbi:MAG: hypothetical protein IJT94_16615 [Oscillibacter sp.]|nr:hypothetical protein [Oscillibacter sp.]